MHECLIASTALGEQCLLLQSVYPHISVKTINAREASHTKTFERQNREHGRKTTVHIHPRGHTKYNKEV